MSALFHKHYLFASLLALILLAANSSHAAFFVPRAQDTVSEQRRHPLVVNAFKTRSRPFGPASAQDDSYKGIVSIIAGSGGLLCLSIAFAASLFGFLLPAFILGVGSIVFGAMRKKSYRTLARVGLILGIIDVAVILLFIVAVIVALASFT